MDFRHEWKIEINTSDLLALRSRLRVLMEPDEHAVNGRYLIRSLYFDTPTDKALREKIDGVNRREKFRVRYYNGDTGFLSLEKKSKLNGLSNKEAVQITTEQAREIAAGNIPQLMEDSPPLLRELCVKMRTQGLRPKTVVDYTREPFVYRPGNVRVTFDYGIRTGLGCTDFLNPELVTVPAGDAPILIRIESKAGHGAGKPTSKRIDEAADSYAFLFQNIGVPYEVIHN